MTTATKRQPARRSLRPADSDYWRRPLARELDRFVRKARGRRIRSRLDFAKQTVRIPEGPFEGKYFRESFQPYSAAALRLMDSSLLRFVRIAGCVQSGKSFTVLILLLWHLFERGEDVGYGVPELDQSARDKWQQEILPVIMNSPELRRFMPTSGTASRGGTPSMITFLNGATLRFISGTGGDHHRSNFTVPVTIKTEVDRYDTATGVSREASPPVQITNRTAAYGDQAFDYEECTVTTETGRIWQELQESTNHRFAVVCPFCEAARNELSRKAFCCSTPVFRKKVRLTP